MKDNVRILEKKVRSSDGVHDLAGRVYLPEGEPKAIFHVVHGMTEYLARYDGFMKTLADNGYLTFGYDNLGHGLTARDEAELGFIASKDGWKRLVDDVDVFASAIRAEYGEELPYILMGHSMGSFIVRLAAAKFDRQDKLIIMGTGGPNPAAGPGLALSKIVKAFKGERHRSKLIEDLAFSKYNERFKDEDDDNAWLSKDRELRNKYEKDKYCSYRFTVSAMADLISLNRASNDKNWARSMNKNKPVLLVSGTDDPVGEYGKGVRKVYDMLVSEGVKAEIKLYENCRHEILNDDCREEVIADILAFAE